MAYRQYDPMKDDHPDPGIILTVLFWAVMLSVPVAAMVIGIGYMSYWTITPFPVLLEGDPLFRFDPETGYAARPNSSTKWTVLGTDDKPFLQYHVHTDQRSARVVNRAERTPDHVDILLLGDSFTWGHGIEGEETFAFQTIAALGSTGANFALPGYGTIHSLQILRRHRDLAPKLVVLTVNAFHAWRNVSACGASAYPFCLDSSHVAWDREGRPYIARPWSDGVARVHLQMQAERGRLDALTWIIHGMDVTVARVRAQIANANALDPARQNAAFEFLIEQMAVATREMKATLLIVFLADETLLPPPELLSRSAARLGYSFLDLRPVFMKIEESVRRHLYLKNDGHPSAAGHALIAQELIAFIRREKLLAR
jgi:GDSL-like Lipase/Acylhydrolase family